MAGSKNIAISNECPFCGETNVVYVNPTSYEAWRRGATIQVAFPDLSLSQREIIKTGICDSCWPSEE